MENVFEGCGGGIVSPPNALIRRRQADRRIDRGTTESCLSACSVGQRLRRDGSRSGACGTRGDQNGVTQLTESMKPIVVFLAPCGGQRKRPALAGGVHHKGGTAIKEMNVSRVCYFVKDFVFFAYGRGRTRVCAAVFSATIHKLLHYSFWTI